MPVLGFAPRARNRCGFEAAGIRKRYYENIDDAIVMWCTELATPQYRQMLVELCPEAAR